MARYVALFGSINVGGNRLTMADLRAAFEAEGLPMSRPSWRAAMSFSRTLRGRRVGWRKS
jgi:hypothetical protein